MKEIEPHGLFEYLGNEIHMYVPNRIKKVVITRSGVTYSFPLPDEIRIVASKD